jgi:aryl-alcohol dehydrogenase-like predicted oxidoreductase
VWTRTATTWSTLLDTGDFYGMGHNELLIHEALAARDALRGSRRDQLVLSVKFGAAAGDRYPAAGMATLDSEKRAR